jgi:hypothetical protein
MTKSAIFGWHLILIQLKQCETEAIFQNKVTIYKANLPSFVQNNYKKSLLCGLISQTSAEKPPKNGGVRKANCSQKVNNIFSWFYIRVKLEFAPISKIQFVPFVCLNFSCNANSVLL